MSTTGARMTPGRSGVARRPKPRVAGRTAPTPPWPAHTAARRQMVSAVPLGRFLSGGLDSGAVVATMKAATKKVTSYTVGFSEEDLAHEIVPDDLGYARRLSRELDLDNHERVLKPEIV